MSTLKRTAPTPRAMSDLLSARLHALANLSAATTTLRVERKFGLSLLEWRSLGQLGGFAPLSLKDLAVRAGLDKSYASRTISNLIERDLVASERNDTDGRGVMLSLTEKGQDLYGRAFRDAVARNEKLLAPLRADQRALLIEMLGILTLSARQALHDERNIQGDEEPANETLTSESVDTGPNMIEMRYLVSRLSEVLNSR